MAPPPPRLRPTRLLAVLALFAAYVTATPTLNQVEFDTSPVRLNVGERFIFSLKCEERRNENTGVLEKCCSGNYKCEHAVCKGKSPCTGFLASFFWCHGRECKPVANQPPPSKSPTPTPSVSASASFEPEDTPEPSFEEDIEEWTDEGEEIDVDEADDEKNRDTGRRPTRPDPDATKSVTPTPTPTKSASMTPSKSPTVTPSNSPTPSNSEKPVPSSSQSPTPSSEPPSPLPSPPASPPPAEFDDLNCIGRRERKDIRDLTPDERARWVRAVRKLMEQPADGGLSEWEQLTQLHFMHGDEAHGGCYFLPWHRLFLLKIENLMRVHEPDVTMPYWDWTRDSLDASVSEIWGSEYIGGAQRENQPIPDGPFAGLVSRFPDWHTVARNFWSGSSRNMNAFWTWNDLERVVSQQSWADFADGIESAHILPHNEIGGDMRSTDTAPNDPVFYLHHGYVDYLYQIRQQRNFVTEFGGTHDFATGTVACDPEMIFNAFGIPARRAMDVWCVRYTTAVDGGVNQARGRSVTRKVEWDESHCYDKAFLENQGMSRERCLRQFSILRGVNSTR